METIKLLQGARLDLQVTAEDDDSVSATIILRSIVQGAEPIEFTEPFENKVADFQNVEGISNLTVGKYELQLNENFATGLPYKYPDADQCDDECEFPLLEICEALDE